jgi:hypothetical protein
MKLIRPLLLGLGLIAANTGLAQEEEEERWYRVELLIFSHESSAAPGSEQWEPTPSLAYPVQGRFLVDPQRVADNLAAYDATSVVDELGHQTLTIIPPPVEDDEDEEIPLTEPEPEPESEAIIPTTPSPFIVLAHSELEFQGKAAYMQRTGRYQTLFHETWLQPMVDQGRTRPIIIDRSGDSETWPRLQGSVKLYVSRYLHLETNLWLNTSGSYLPQGWDMPAAPLGPTSLTVIYPPEPEPEPELESDVEPEAIDTGFFAPIGEQQAEQETLEPEGPVYPWRHAIALQQKRKMRSTELHYIDHPMLGVVVKITPLTEEELQQRATAEQEQAQAETLKK